MGNIRPMQRFSVILADDHRLFAESLKLMFKTITEFELEILAEAENGYDVLELLRQHQPDLLILDLNMPGKDGIKVLQDWYSTKRITRSLVLTSYEDESIVKKVVQAGAHGYLLKNCTKEELINAIQTVMSGNRYLPEREPEGIRPGAASTNQVFDDTFRKKYNLTKREMEVLKLIAKAMNNKQIGQMLYISDQTVGVHRKNIMKKMGVSNTAGLIKLAYDNNIV
jgi:DNA-binding NarL/FixJ family response regulator